MREPGRKSIINMKQADDKSLWFSKPSSERSVISICLQNINSYIEARSKLSASDFLSADNRAVYVAMDVLYNTGITEFDLPSVVSVSQDMDILEDVGGYAYIDALFCSKVSKANLGVYINQILDASLKYKLERDLLEKAELVYNSGNLQDVSAASVLSKVENSILSLSFDTLKVEDGKQISQGLRDRLKEFESSPTTVRGLKSGFGRLDRLINGFSPGTLSVVAARAKTGKSALLLNWATHMCLYEHAPVLYIDTEMSTEEVQTRQLSLISGVPERVILNGLYINNNTQSEAVYYALGIMEKMKYFHKYMPGYSIEDVKSMVRKYKAKENIGAFIFDYVKMVELGSSYNESQLLGVISASLKDLAGILGIPCITAVQLKRDSHQKSKVGSDEVGDSDKVLRYCNLLMALTQKTKKEIDEDGRDCGTHRLQILDNRGGVSLYNGIDLEFVKPILTIKEAKVQSTASFIEQKELEEKQ